MDPFQRLRHQLRPLWRWLIPGLGVKRWLGVLLAGTTFIGLALAFIFVDLYRSTPPSPIVSILTLQFLPHTLRAAALLAVGLSLVLLATARINRSVLAPYVRPGRAVVDVLSEHRRRGRGPKVVAIGGGTGLSVLLRGLKAHTNNITAIVTVADDGGSSGRLRRSLGVLPPGDFRNCLAALSDDESLTTQLFQYRFGQGDGLGGHSFGNLFLTAMSEITGSFERGLLESSHVLATRGRVVPATLQDVTLAADVMEEPGDTAPLVQGVREWIGGRVSRVEGESRIPEAAGAIQRVYLKPDDPPAYPEAVQALLAADLIVAGPGSLYTSVIPNLLVPDIALAIQSSRAQKVYVCNAATQPGETDGYSVLDHVAAIERHTVKGIFPIVLANSNQSGVLLPKLDWVRFDASADGSRRVIAADVVLPAAPWRHSSDKLAEELMGILASDV